MKVRLIIYYVFKYTMEFLVVSALIIALARSGKMPGIVPVEVVDFIVDFSDSLLSSETADKVAKFVFSVRDFVLDDGHQKKYDAILNAVSDSARQMINRVFDSMYLFSQNSSFRLALFEYSLGRGAGEISSSLDRFLESSSEFVESVGIVDLSGSLISISGSKEIPEMDKKLLESVFNSGRSRVFVDGGKLIFLKPLREDVEGVDGIMFVVSPFDSFVRNLAKEFKEYQISVFSLSGKKIVSWSDDNLLPVVAKLIKDEATDWKAREVFYLPDGSGGELKIYAVYPRPSWVNSAFVILKVSIMVFLIVFLVFLNRQIKESLKEPERITQKALEEVKQARLMLESAVKRENGKSGDDELSSLSLRSEKWLEEYWQQQV